jgi:hypothetical protein
MPTTTGRVDTWEMVLVHRAFRREFRILPGLIRAVNPSDSTRAGVVGEHLADLTGALQHHHTAEDELLWPALLTRAGVPANLVQRMQAQHDRLHVLLERIDQLTPQWRVQAGIAHRDELSDIVAQASAALDEHLADEETQILPLVEQHITHAEWDALNQRGQQAIPKNAKAFVFLGVILAEATSQESTLFLRQLPAPVRWAWRLAGTRIYRRADARLHNRDQH